MLLSKSTFTIIPLCVSSFSIPIFNYTSLSILKVLLTSLCLLPSFAVPSRAPAHILLCCAFVSLGHAVIPQFHYGFFSPILHSGHKIFLFSSSNTFSLIIIFFLPYFVHSTLLPLLLSSFLFLHFHALRHFVYHIFLSCFLEINPCP